MSELTEGLSDIKLPEQYAAWLWDVLAELYPKFGEVDRDSRLYRFIKGRTATGIDSPLDALNLVYKRCIPAPSQNGFRHAIGTALKRCAESTDRKVFRPTSDLVYLLGATKAVEALEGLLEVNSTEFIAINHDSLLFDTIANVKSLPSNDTVYSFTSNLVQVPFFDDGYLFDALGIMLDCKPDAGIVDKYGERIRGLYSLIKGDKEEEAAYWNAIDLNFSMQSTVIEMIRSYSKF
ncbi:MAG: hypothetical protein ABIF10_02410 [Candidatus Woesearchaeota archaeon]